MGSRLWIGRDNPLIDAATITARSDEGGDYALSNLQFHQLEPPYRTAAKALELDGANDYAWVADHADFDIVGDLTLEILIEPDTVAGTPWLIDKLGANDGYLLRLDGDEIAVFIRGITNCQITTTAANLLVDTWYRIKAIYDASAEEVSIFLNGIEIARATDLAQTGCVLVGNIPAAIVANPVRFTIGADSTNANKFNGEIGFAGIDNAEHDNGGYLDPSGCAGYWNFDDSDLTDSSGNGHTLTGVSIDSSNYQDCTAFAWIGIEYDATQNPKGLFVDPRNNLATGATWKLCRGDWFSTYELIDSGTVTENEPIISLPDDNTNTKWWLEFHEADNADGYLEFSFIYLGQRLALTAASLSLNRIKAPQMRTITQVRTEAGNIRTSIKSNLYVHILSSIYPMEGADLVEMLAAAAYASQGHVIIFCYDSEDAVNNTWAMYWLDAATFSPQLMRQRGPAGGEEEIESAEIDFLQLIESA